MATTSKTVQPKNGRMTASAIRDRMVYHLTYTRCKDWRSATDYDKEVSFALALV